MQAHEQRRGALWALASATAYSLSSIIGKELLPTLGPTSLLWWRFTLASIVVWAVLALRATRGGVDPLAVPRARLFGLGAFFGLSVLLGFMALERIDVSLYIVIVYLYPVFVVLASVAMGQSIDRLTGVALAVICIGIVLTVPELFSGAGSKDLVGVLFTLGQAVTFAIYILLSNKVIPPGTDGLTVSGWSVLGAATVLTPLALLNGLSTPGSVELIRQVVLFALVPTALAIALFFRALRSISPGLLAMIMTFEIALAIIWSMLLLGERLSAIKLLGAGVVMAGVALAQWASTAAPLESSGLSKAATKPSTTNPSRS